MSYQPVRTLLFFAVTALGVSCTPASPDAAAPAQTEAEAIAAIQAQAQRFSAAYVAGDIETLLSIYAEDGIAAPGGRDFIRGRDALRAYWQIPEGRAVTHHQSRSDELIVEGKYAYDWGYYEGAAGPIGNPQPFEGKYVIIWRLDGDGVWRMVQDMWNSMPRPEAAP